MSDTSGPAFPINANESADRCIYTGMTLRDYFAAKAMQALIGAAKEMPTGFGEAYMDNNNCYARAAYAVSDAMLEARK